MLVGQHATLLKLFRRRRDGILLLHGLGRRASREGCHLLSASLEVDPLLMRKISSGRSSLPSPDQPALTSARTPVRFTASTIVSGSEHVLLITHESMQQDA